MSVVIATYNWSAALRCAIRSVLLQTMPDFELLVVGDACTDDTAEAVASFNDPRIRWHNLPHNHGGQWAPNNFGIAASRGEFIAYLGHDDLWYPTHLAAGLRALREQQADLAAGITILYGPPGSRERWIGGVFNEGVYSPADFMPPSSLVHRKNLIDRIGPWKDPATCALPVDCELLTDAHAAGARIVGTNELTVFKFNAAWRRDSYRTKDVAEQTEMLRRIESGRDFRGEELTAVLHAVRERRSKFLEIPAGQNWSPGEVARRNLVFKGVIDRYRQNELRSVERAERFGLEQDFPGFEWHTLETDEKFGTFRWSGPGSSSMIDVPILFDRKLAVRVHILQAIDPAILRTLDLFIGKQRIELIQTTTESGTSVFSGVALPPEGPPAPIRVTLRVANTLRPLDLGASEDTRWLGVAVNWIELEPL